jgi:plastocyanin
MTDEEIASPAKSSNAGMKAAIFLVALIPLIVFLVLLTRPNATTYRFTIPKGTQAATESGQAVANPLPTNLTVKIGDSVEVINNDDAPHTYSFLVLRPGETGRYTFRNTGVFLGTCTVGDHKDVSITVIE